MPPSRWYHFLLPACLRLPRTLLYPVSRYFHPDSPHPRRTTAVRFPAPQMFPCLLTAPCRPQIRRFPPVPSASAVPTAPRILTARCSTEISRHEFPEEPAQNKAYIWRPSYNFYTGCLFPDNRPLKAPPIRITETASLCTAITFS